MENDNSVRIAKNTYFFGTGLANLNGKSEGLGLGVLSLLFASIQEARNNGCFDILHELGTVGYNITEEDKKEQIRSQMILFDKLSDSLSRLKIKDKNNNPIGTINLSHILSENYQNAPHFKELLDITKNKLAEFDKIEGFEALKRYTSLQIAQNRFLSEEKGIIHKTGWTPSGKIPEDWNLNANSISELILKGHINEFYFDQMLKYCFPELNLKTSYISGDTDFETGLRHAPYSITLGEHRPLLNGRFREFCLNRSGFKHKKDAIKDIKKKIVLPFEDLFGEIPSKGDSNEETTINKIEIIQDQLLGEITR